MIIKGESAMSKEMYPEADSDVEKILTTIFLFRDKPEKLKEVLKLHLECAFLRGKVAGVEGMKP
jgi:hypothetical protein